jgi:hypothetical protein
MSGIADRYWRVADGFTARAEQMTPTTWERPTPMRGSTVGHG